MAKPKKTSKQSAKKTAKKTAVKNKRPIPSPYTRSAEECYFEAMELLEGDIGAINEAFSVLDEGYELDPKSVEIQVGFIHAYGVLGIQASVHAHIDMAYALTCAHFPTWPQELLWGEIENRPYLRAIHYYADRCADQGRLDEAKASYQLLLRLNPGDNQGVRFLLAGLYAGLSGDDINALMDLGNRKQDWSALDSVLQEQNQKHKFWNPPTFSDDE